MDSLIRDVMYGLRMLRSRPAFAAAAILTLALGIGANTAIFTLVNSVLLRQLPYRQPDRLVWIWSTRTDLDKAFYSIPNFIDTQDQTQTFDQMAAFASWGVNLTGTAEAERLQGVRISASAFELLGVEAAVGRTLLTEDDDPANPPVVVISYGLWQRQFGGDGNVVGRRLSLNGDPYTVVGVLPPNFNIPNAEVEIAASLRLAADSRRGERGSNFLRVFARLKSAVTIDQARAELEAITARLREQYPAANGKHTPPSVSLLHAEMVGRYRDALFLLFGAVGLVLLIACGNLANLLLSRAAARHKEVAIRAALGATRWRLIRQMLTESILLAILGGTLGFFCATLGKDSLLSLGPADLPRAGEIDTDISVLLFSLGISALAGIFFGIVPALQSTRSDLNAELKEGGRGGSEGRTLSRTRDILVISEVALSSMLLIGAGLMLKSFAELQGVSPGFEADRLLTVRLSLPTKRYAQPAAVTVFHDRLTARLKSLSGVESVAVANVLPLSGMNARTDFTIVGRAPASPDAVPAAQNRWVSPGWFDTMKIPLKRGRDFAEADREHSKGVVVIDEALATRYWPSADPIGQHLLISFGGEQPRDFEIIGVAGNVKHASLNEEETGTLYAPIYQVPPTVVSFLAGGLSVVVRSSGGSDALPRSFQNELKTLDSAVAASGIRTVDQMLSASVAGHRFNLLLLSVFAVVALLLAAAGLYGVVAYVVTQRTREIGIRLALGARRQDMLKLIMSQGVRLILIGITLGLVGALIITRFMKSLLFAVSATDPPTYVLVALLLSAVALLACYVPARRAMKVDPIVALRQE